MPSLRQIIFPTFCALFSLASTHSASAGVSDMLELSAEIGSQAEEVGPSTKSAFKALAKSNPFITLIETDYKFRNGDLSAYEDTPHYLYPRLAAQIAAAPVTKLVPGIVYMGCKLSSAGCPAIVVSTGEQLESFDDMVGDLGEVPLRALDRYGYEANAREAERRSNGERGLYETAAFQNAFRTEQAMMDRLSQAFEWASLSPTPKPNANQRNGSGLTPAERDSPPKCIQGRPYWDGGCFDPQAPPPKFGFSDQSGPRLEDYVSQATNPTFNQGGGLDCSPAGQAAAWRRAGRPSSVNYACPNPIPPSQLR